MPMSPYVRSLRGRIGHDLLLLPGVTAVIRDSDRFLLARQRDTERWSLIGGGIEPGETSHEAVAREVLEEVGVTPKSCWRLAGSHALRSTVLSDTNGSTPYSTTPAERSVMRGGDAQKFVRFLACLGMSSTVS